VLGAGALIVAGLGSGTFWGLGLFDVFDAGWAASLALHGLWVGSLAIGVIRLVQPLRGSAAVAGWVGVAATIIGMITSFPLFGVGLIVLATTQWPQGARRPAAATLVAGAILLLGSLPLEGRFEGAGTPELGTAAALLFAPAVLLVSIGLILLGLQLLRAKRDQVKVTPVPQPAAGP
jgi:hypothetical protein